MKNDTPTVDNPESTEEVQEQDGFNSIDAAFAKVRGSRKPKEEEPTPEPEEEDAEEGEDSTEPEESESTEDKEESEDSTEDGKSSDDDDDVLSQTDEIDFDALTDDQKDALREKLEIKGHKAFAEMRVKLKEAEKKLSEQANEQATKLEQETTGQNAFSKVSDPDELSKQVQQAEVNVDYFTDALLKKRVTQYDEESGEDKTGIEHEGKFYDEKFVIDYVEKQKQALKDGKQRQKQLESYTKLADKQADMVAEKKTKLGIEAGSKASDEYDKLLENQSFQAVARAMPDYAKELIDLFGLSVVAKQGSKEEDKLKLKRKGPKGKVTTESPPKGIGSEAANSTSAKIAALEKRLKQGVSSKEEMLRIARQKRQLLNSK